MRGYVTDERGAGLSGLRLLLARADGGWIAWAHSDARGRFRIRAPRGRLRRSNAERFVTIELSVFTGDTNDAGAGFDAGDGAGPLQRARRTIDFGSDRPSGLAVVPRIVEIDLRVAREAVDRATAAEQEAAEGQAATDEAL